jgi:CHAT domain-containing protein
MWLFRPTFYALSQWGDQRKSLHTAWALAVLSYQFGDSTIAAKRLNVAAQRAKQIPDLQEWLSVMNLQYVEGRDAGVPAEQLRPIRDAATNAAGDLRAQYVSRAGRIWVGHLADKLYGDLLRDQLGESRELTAASFSFAESLKARTLLDVLYFPPVAATESPDVSSLEQRALGLSTATPDDQKGEKGGKDDIGANEYKLISHLSFFYEDMLNASEEKPSPRSQAIGELESACKKTGGGFHAVAAPASLSEIQRALKPREAVLGYVIPYHRSHPAFDLYILLVTPASAKSVHVALNEVLPFNVPMIGTMMIGKEATEYSQLSETVVQTRIAIQTGDEKAAQGSLRDLYKILIQPLIVQGVRLADFDHLVIVPHGPLHYVPFAALLDGDGKYLISKTALTVVPSA